MSAAWEREIHGLPELRAKLKQLPVEIGRAVLRKGVGAGAGVVKLGVRAHMATAVHRRTGTLARAVIANYRKRDSNDTQQVYVVLIRSGKRFQQRQSKKGRVVASSDAYYARWVEAGHKIVPRSPRVAGTYPNGTRLYQTTLRFRRRLNQGRVAPHPYFVPGFEASATPAITAMTTTIAAELKRYGL